MIIKLYQRLDTDGGQLFTVEANIVERGCVVSYTAYSYIFHGPRAEVVDETRCQTEEEAETAFLNLIAGGEA